MAAVWAYPWTLMAEGLDDICNALAERGIEALNVASHYHSVRSMQPSNSESLFREFPGGCYFSPTEERFGRIAIDPQPIGINGVDDPLEAVVEIAHDHGLAVNAWTVCLHNSRLGATNPDYRIESAFGDAHDHSLCPSHPEVREYFAAVIEAEAARGVDEVHIESIGFPNVFHGHNHVFGHDKRQALTGPVETVLLSQCFCDGCKAAATSHSVDFERAKKRVRSLLEPSLADPTTDLGPLSDLADDGTIRQLFDFRASVIEGLIARLACTAREVPLNYYVAESLGGAMPGEGWVAGVRLDRLEKHLDCVTAMCYCSDPEIATDRVQALDRLIDRPIDAGVTLDPTVVESDAHLNELVDAIKGVTNGRISFYHHGLMTDAQLEWVAALISR